MLAAAEARVTLAKQAEAALMKLKEVQKEFDTYRNAKAQIEMSTVFQSMAMAQQQVMD